MATKDENHHSVYPQRFVATKDTRFRHAFLPRRVRGYKARMPNFGILIAMEVCDCKGL